jgi:hypothetical protein
MTASAAPGGMPFAEGWPSGQWQQTVNLPVNTYVGSNPTPSTKALRPGDRVTASVRVAVAGEAGVAQW